MKSARTTCSIASVAVAAGAAVASLTDQAPALTGGLAAASLLLCAAVPMIRSAERRIADRHRHDPLTGLANRTELQAALRSAVDAAEKGLSPGFCVCFVDLDGFKQVNDKFGHGAGDTLLKEVATRIRSSIRNSDVACRQGGDEFVIVLSDRTDYSEIATVCRRIADVVASPVEIGHGRFTSVTSSIGIAVWPADGRCPEVLLRNADTAMYDAKSKGKSREAFYSKSMGEKLSERIEMGEALRAALVARDLELWFQPQFDIKNGIFSGAEALVRWKMPDGSLVSTQKLVEVAESSRLIADLGNFVLEAAAKAIFELEAEGIPLRIAVNVSPAHFLYSNVERDVSHRLDVYGVDPSMLDIEITESVLLRSEPEIEEQLRNLRARGVGIVLDDFGTGYSNFGFVNRERVDKIKIDRSFVKDFPSHQDRAAIVQAILLFGNRLGIPVVAEGVETKEAALALANDGCQFAQGFLYSPAIPFERLVELVREQALSPERPRFIQRKLVAIR